MSRTCLLVAYSIVFITNLQAVKAQHCPPIVESYIESYSVKHIKDGISFSIDYKKTGGQSKEAYQAYVVAYSDFATDKLLEMSPQEALDTKVASVVHTQLAKRQENGCYGIQCSLKTRDLVAALIKDSQLDREQIDDMGGWQSFKGRIRFAVFIPFLEDKKFSVMEDLPENKHECNYLGEDGLIFESLPQLFSIHFGIVQGVRIPEGDYYIQINGNRASGKDKKEAR